MKPKQFIEYFIQFYGPMGLYPIDGIRIPELKRLCRLGIDMRGAQFEGDSFDREAIRDMILVSKNKLGGVFELGIRS